MNQSMGRHARGFFIAMCVEFGLYGLYLFLAWREGEPLAEKLIRVAVIFLSIRALMVAGNFLQTYLARSPVDPENQIGLLASLKLYLNELWAAIWTYPFYFAFEALVSNAPKPGLAHQGPPIVLVPGFLCNRGYYGKFRRFLEKNGYGNVWTVTLEPVFGSIEDNARHLGQLVEQICQQTQQDKVILIGHSMGGVVIRTYLDQQGGAKRVARAISLGSPFGGTVLAKGPSGLGENLRQMTVGSEFSKQLVAAEDQPCSADFTAIWSPHDSIVAPQKGTSVKPTYGRNVVMPGVGHMEMIVSKPVMRKVLEILQSPTG